MTADEFRAALRELGISQRWLAEKMRAHVSAVNRWAKGGRPVPGYVEYILRLLDYDASAWPTKSDEAHGLTASADRASHRPETPPSGAH